MGILRHRAGTCAVLVAALVALAGGAATAPPEDATPLDPQMLVERAFANLYGFTSIQHVAIRARQADGREFERTLQVARRGVAQGLNRMLLRFLGPGDLRGIALLLLERPDFSYDAFLYQPAYQRVRRVTMAQRHDAFFGTNVAFEDLEAKRASQWRARLLREEPVHDRTAWVLELEPQGVPSGYSRIVAWFDLELPVMLRAEFYRQGKQLKVMEVDASRIVEIDGYFVPSRMTFRGAAKSVTVVEISEIDMREELPDELFTSAALEFGDDRRDARAP